MEHGLRPINLKKACVTIGLNPYCNGTWSPTLFAAIMRPTNEVLILIVMEHGLRRAQLPSISELPCRLNPYCNGTWSPTIRNFATSKTGKSLNPYCNGTWSPTKLVPLVVLLRPVLILIVMEHGLRLNYLLPKGDELERLNPYCNGTWSPTTQSSTK